MLKIFISNLKEYNNGKIIGEWVSLPCEGLEEVLNKISNNGNDELFISDYETDISNLKISEYDDILQLNEIAEEIDNLSDDELIAFQAYLEQYANNMEQALEEVRQGNYRIYYNCDNMEDVAYQAVNESGLLDGVPEQVKMYFDYEAYGSYFVLSRIPQNSEVLDVCFLINYHMLPFSWESEKTKQRWRKRFGEYKYKMLMDFHECDIQR